MVTKPVKPDFDTLAASIADLRRPREIEHGSQCDWQVRNSRNLGYPASQVRFEGRYAPRHRKVCGGLE